MHGACQTVHLLQCDNHQSWTEVAMEVRARQKSHIRTTVAHRNAELNQKIWFVNQQCNNYDQGKVVRYLSLPYAVLFGWMYFTNTKLPLEEPRSVEPATRSKPTSSESTDPWKHKTKASMQYQITINKLFLWTHLPMTITIR